jgi:hypothetical protein
MRWTYCRGSTKYWGGVQWVGVRLIFRFTYRHFMSCNFFILILWSLFMVSVRRRKRTVIRIRRWSQIRNIVLLNIILLIRIK